MEEEKRVMTFSLDEIISWNIKISYIFVPRVKGSVSRDFRPPVFQTHLGP